jgi:uncharacterized membrane protein
VLGLAETASAKTATNSNSTENGLAAVAYILTWITGLIILLTAKKEEKFKRWHAIQAIGLGVAQTVFYVIFNIVLVGGVYTAGASGYALWSILSMLVNLAIIASIIVMAITAYQGKKVRLPIIAGIADKNA